MTLVIEKLLKNKLPPTAELFDSTSEEQGNANVGLPNGDTSPLSNIWEHTKGYKVGGVFKAVVLSTTLLQYMYSSQKQVASSELGHRKAKSFILTKASTCEASHHHHSSH
jgi:hypothetical protein